MKKYITIGAVLGVLAGVVFLWAWWAAEPGDELTQPADVEDIQPGVDGGSVADTMSGGRSVGGTVANPGGGVPSDPGRTPQPEPADPGQTPSPETAAPPD